MFENGISEDSNTCGALYMINSDYDQVLKSNEGKVTIFFFEGAGADPNPDTHRNALCVVVKDRKILYINLYSTTIPDNPFNPSLNGGMAMPTLCQGVYDFENCIHLEDVSVSARLIPYAALEVKNDEVVRHRSDTDYYTSTSGAIHIHARSRNRDNTTKASQGCLVVGDVFNTYTDQYAAFLKAVGVIDGNTNVWVGTKCKYGAIGKVVVDRSQAYDYLKAVGYSDDVIGMI